MSKRTAPKDSKASGFKTLKAFFTSGPKKSPTSSTATTAEPDNPGSSTPETPIQGPSRLLEPLAPLATIKDESLSSISSISPLSEQALHSPSLQLTGHGQGHQVCTAGQPQQTPTASLAIRTCDETRKTRKANFSFFGIYRKKVVFFCVFVSGTLFFFAWKLKTTINYQLRESITTNQNGFSNKLSQT